MKLLPLTMLSEGEEGIIVEVNGGEAITRKLLDIGFVPGARVKVLKRSSSSTLSTLLVDIKEGRVMLGCGAAMRIIVRINDGE